MFTGEHHRLFTYSQIVHITASSIQIVACVLEWHVENKKETPSMRFEVVFAVCEPGLGWKL